MSPTPKSKSRRGASTSKWHDPRKCGCFPGHVLYRLPKRVHEFGQVYDAATHSVHEDVEWMVEELDLDMSFDVVKRRLARHPMAKAARRCIRPRRGNPYNNPGFELYFVYDEVNRRGLFRTATIDDYDYREVSGVSWDRFVSDLVDQYTAFQASIEPDW